MMHKRNINRNYTRRDFFKFLVAAISVSSLSWWLIVGRRGQLQMRKYTVLFFGSDIPTGISFHDQIVLIKDKEMVRAFEAKCTHLGCKIKKAVGKEIICQCHGSRFDMFGNPVQGPAGRPLKELKVFLNKETGNYEVTKGG